jgi:hypothetical protein
MYEVFAGSLPFQGESFMGILTQHITTEPEPVTQRAAKAGRQLPMGLAEIITRCMQKSPAQRYSTMDELVNALIQIYRGVAGPGMSTYMEAFPVGPSGRHAVPTPPPLTGPVNVGAAHAPTQSPHMLPQGHGTGPMPLPTGSSGPNHVIPSAGSSSALYPGYSGVPITKKSNTGLIVAILVVLIVGGGVAIFAAVGGKEGGGGSGTGSQVAVVEDAAGGGSSGSGEAPVADAMTAPVDAAVAASVDAPEEPPKPADAAVVVPETVDILIKSRYHGSFEVWEDEQKLFDGPDNLPVVVGESRKITIKARGYKDKTFTVASDAKGRKFEFKLDRAPGPIPGLRVRLELREAAGRSGLQERGGGSEQPGVPQAILPVPSRRRPLRRRVARERWASSPTVAPFLREPEPAKEELDMRNQASMIPRVARYVVLAIAMVFATGTVAADSRSDARAHYQAGVKFYSSGDYQSAIREFSAAQQLLPADLNNYNLALCYDKLGDPEPAIQYYRAYLDKQPNTDKRAEIEASISRLDGALKSVAAKKEEARKAEEARRAEEQRRAEEARRIDEQRRAEEARKAEEQRRAEEARRPAPIGPVGPGTAGPDPNPGVGGSTGGPTGGIGGGSTGTPGSGMPTSTGDAQLDRVQQIDVGSVRDQRVGSASSGMIEPRGGNPGADPRVGAAEPPPPGMPGTPDDKPKVTPVYKKWWFWAVVAVAAYVVYAVATEDSAKSSSRARELPLGPMPLAPQAPGGLTLMRW